MERNQSEYTYPRRWATWSADHMSLIEYVIIFFVAALMIAVPVLFIYLGWIAIRDRAMTDITPSATEDA